MSDERGPLDRDLGAPDDSFSLDAQSGGFLARLAVANRELGVDLGLHPETEGLERSIHVDSLFVAFLRTMARFGVFSFGPITLYVPTVEAALDITEAPQPVTTKNFVRLTEIMREEQARVGDSRITELHALLAFMKIGVGLPARVFGELGVSPRQVEEYALNGAAATEGLEQLYSPEDAARYLGIHVQTVRSWIRSGRLKASRLTGQRALRIKASDLATVLEPVKPEGATSAHADL